MPVYDQLSERFSDFAFFDLSGDESPELRQLMKVWCVQPCLSEAAPSMHGRACNVKSI